VVIWITHHSQSRLCVILVAPTGSCLSVLLFHSVSTITNTATHHAPLEFCTSIPFTKHPDVKSQSEVFLPSLMKRFCFGCSLQSCLIGNWQTQFHQMGLLFTLK
jgi:hypothetical protein